MAFRWPRQEFLAIGLAALTWFSSGLSAEEVQAHGFRFERWLCDTFFDGYNPESYTQKWDIPADANLRHGGIPANPKAIKYRSPVGLGDAKRQFEIEEPFLLILAFWEQADSDQKRWVNAQAIPINPATWKALWHPIADSDLDHLISVIKDETLSLTEARAKAKSIKSKPPFSEAVMQVNPKIDSNQRRLQCSLRFDDVFQHLIPDADPSVQTQPTIFGKALPKLDQSPPRTFDSKSPGGSGSD